MRAGARRPLELLVLLALLVTPSSSAAPPQRTSLTVGYLTAAKGPMRDRQGLAISGAVTMAINEVNADPDILPQVELVIRWNDTKGDTVLATKAITDMMCDGVIAFIGPEGNCYVEGIVSQAQNIPMISYKCSDYRASAIPTFARTEPPDLQVTKSVISLLKYYRWQKFSIIHEKRWRTVALSLENHAKKHGMTVNRLREVLDTHQCCEQHLECCSANYWHDVIEETKGKTRIYVYLGLPSSLTDFMVAMDQVGLFLKGEYMVIFVDMLTYSPKEAQKYLWKSGHKVINCKEDGTFKKRAQSLLVIVATPPGESYTVFAEKVQEYNTKEPFKFGIPSLFNQSNFSKFVSIYAAYLYDAVKLYANALHEQLESEKDLTPSRIREIASNGSLIISAISNKTFISITGATIRLDESGDSEGNFSVLALKPMNQTELQDISCDHFMVPVGYFQQSPDGEFPEYRLNPKLPIEWVNNVRPADEPSCGFMDEKCPKSDNHESSLVVAGTLAVTLFCTAVIIISIYRKWKIEQEIEGLLWKIDPSDIRGYGGNDIVPSPSKLSLISAGSFESRCGNQVFATRAQFRGNLVRIKELKFSKKKVFISSI